MGIKLIFKGKFIYLLLNPWIKLNNKYWTEIQYGAWKGFEVSGAKYSGVPQNDFVLFVVCNYLICLILTTSMAGMVRNPAKNHGQKDEASGLAVPNTS